VRILNRYILREVLSHAGLGLALFTFILFMQNLGRILDLVVRDSAPLPSVIELFLYTLPNTLTITLPMAVLVGVLLGLGRMAADSEITAMRAAGVGVYDFVRVVAMIGVGAWVLASVNATVVAPRMTAALLQLESSLKNSQAKFEVQPRVFYEDFSNYVLYVQDIRAGSGAAVWKRVFLADLSNPAAPRITTADQATVVNSNPQEVLMRLRNGATHETTPGDPTAYSISSFASSDVPIQFNAQESERMGHGDSPIMAMSTAQLYELSRGPNGSWYQIEFHKRLAYPFACIVLMLVGIPLGISSQRGGKGTGFILTLLLVFVYYFMSSTGVALARQGKLPAWAGAWAANAIFLAAGLLLLRRMARGTLSVGSLRSIFGRRRGEDALAQGAAPAVQNKTRWQRFPLILDDYVLREVTKSFFLVLITFVMILLIFTFFDLLGDIIRNRTPLITVGEYLLNLMPSMIYISTPLAVLIATLGTFGVLQRTSELTAMRASGISLYRIIAPAMAVAVVLAIALFLFDDFYIPSANRQQESLRMTIKGKPPQTFLRPDRKWIFGEQKGPSEPGKIFYYQFFDPYSNEFANLTVFEFDPASFTLSRRIFADSATWDEDLGRWVFKRGWVRTFAGDTVSGYEPFDVATFPEIQEQPNYFKKEVRQSSEMNFGELRAYIRDLQQSGFDVVQLRVALFHKLAFPLICLIMALIAVPFAMSMGKRGSLTGVAVAIGIAIAYWVVNGLFESMGNANMLPAALAAWSPDLLFALLGGYLLLRTPT
jgi:LPS export ABC transporter permease LptF/LPS export ABC transporter permease LptG